MIDIPRLLDLIETGAIETYKGPVDVFVDRRKDMVVIGQGDERMLVLTVEQAEDLIQVMVYKLMESGSGG